MDFRATAHGFTDSIRKTKKSFNDSCSHEERQRFRRAEAHLTGPWRLCGSAGGHMHLVNGFTIATEVCAGSAIAAQIQAMKMARIFSGNRSGQLFANAAITGELFPFPNKPRV